MILIFAATVAASPAPQASPAPARADVCGAPHTNLLAALDRPSIGYSACAAKPHEVLAELGYSNAAGERGRTATFPQGLLRFGAGPNLELDLIGPAYGIQRLGAARSEGFFDSGIGAKYEFWHDGSRALAADFLYTAPTGAAAFTAGGPTQTLNLDYTMPISSVLSLASTVGAQSDYAAALDGTSARFFSLLPSAVLSDQWNPRAQAYVEGFAQTRTRPDGGALFGMDLAVQYLLTPRLEIDVEAGRILTDVSRSHYVGFGFGARF